MAGVVLPPRDRRALVRLDVWSQPDARPPRFEDALDRVKNRFSGILTDLGLDTPQELNR